MPRLPRSAVTPIQPDAPSTLERDILATIPLARAIAVRVICGDAGQLELAAPLAPNVNDKGCAFGGSLVSLMTLAGWGLVRLALAPDSRPDCDIYVGDSAVRYLAPVYEDLRAVAGFDPPLDAAALAAALATTGKSRARVRCAILLADGSAAATLTAMFFAHAARARRGGTRGE